MSLELLRWRFAHLITSLHDDCALVEKFLIMNCRERKKMLQEGVECSICWKEFLIYLYSEKSFITHLLRQHENIPHILPVIYIRSRMERTVSTSDAPLDSIEWNEELLEMEELSEIESVLKLDDDESSLMSFWLSLIKKTSNLHKFQNTFLKLIILLDCSSSEKTKQIQDDINTGFTNFSQETRQELKHFMRALAVNFLNFNQSEFSKPSIFIFRFHLGTDMMSSWNIPIFTWVRVKISKMSFYGFKTIFLCIYFISQKFARIYVEEQDMKLVSSSKNEVLCAVGLNNPLCSFDWFSNPLCSFDWFRLLSAVNPFSSSGVFFALKFVELTWNSFSKFILSTHLIAGSPRKFRILKIVSPMNLTKLKIPIVL